MIVLTGGKTGGHIMPLIALAKKLDSVCYVGAYGSLEERLCQKHHIPFKGMHLKNNHLIPIIRCSTKLKLKKVKAIIATGGYISFPVLLYGIFHQIPIYLLEENVIMGRTNRFFAKFAKRVFLTFPLPKMKKKYEVVGLPTLTKELSFQKYGFLSIDVLIIGGSLGSKPLCDLAELLKKNYRVCLIAGRYYNDYKDISNLLVFDYIDDLPNLMLQSKLIISRSGASTSYEIFSLGKPCIQIPSSNTSQNHQYLNALYFEKYGCCKLLKETEAKKNIEQLVSYYFENAESRKNMIESQQEFVFQNSCEKIVEWVKQK
ncbi:MAG: UDP-N-acetylglucosamine--N-acetylmuramyl-(pentapeptide) pyrophosphoryl-undecaprenol N-acetylglucosamine transferase [Anaeroplasmataceae bacterium]|nr:UDP-N-acetylglucosamine--N-acetylmuramyl-(pentapeptide) pyrophosphoryl-undecaprenol N-acetylglucosamine transferase [Anaeroplasmataceae bacterium]